MSGFKWPGINWTVVLVGLPLLAAWLEQYFSGAMWVAPAAGALLILAKLVEVYRSGSGETAAPPPGVEAAAAPSSRALTRRSLWWG